MRNRVTISLSTLCLLGAALGSGCLDRQLAPLNPCLVSGVTVQVSVNNIDKIDLLFMVDNSSSMEDKQKNLREHVPQLVNTLVTGMRMPNDPNPFPAATDVHIGIVDSDMGLPGVSGIPGCMGYGDDGLFQHTPHPSPESPTCDASYQKFLSYVKDSPTSPDAAKFSTDFGCVANLGAMGCGFEQQLESVLKSLWPSQDQRIVFLSDGGPERLGHGDLENAGFLRTNPVTGLSLLAIIVLSDEDDGSTGTMELYTPPNQLTGKPPLDPSTINDLNLRPLIGTNRDLLYKTSRYVDGFKALRPGYDNLLVFAAITGVPVDLVNSDATKNVDFTDQKSRDAFYDGILADSRMQNVPDNAPTPMKMVNPSCMTPFGRAYPGRRYIEVAKGIGENSTVYSICEPDYTPAINNIIEIIAKQLRTVCLPRALVRDINGEVQCNVVWELPAPGQLTSAQTPTTCSQVPYLSPPPPDHAQVNAAGGQICTVTQLPVVNDMVPTSGDGWYYDNFSEDVKRNCTDNHPQRVAFTAGAKPPTGVTVKLECLNETQHVVDTRTNTIPNAMGVVPTIGTSCEAIAAPDGGVATKGGDDLCVVHLDDGTTDTSLFCHPQTNTCVKSCTSSTDCPAAWVCDTRDTTLQATMSDTHPNGSFICVNPTCGTSTTTTMQ